MNIIIGCDHGALELKGFIASRLKEYGHSVTDIGCYDSNPVDYPDIAESLCRELLDNGFDFGILLCGTGIGISIAANKIEGIRAAHLSDVYSAAMAKAHNDANVITLGGRTLGNELAWAIVDAYMKADFLGGIHQDRINKIMALEKRG